MLFLAFCLGMSTFLYPKAAVASMCSQQNGNVQTCKIPEITIQLDTFINGKQDNYAKLVKGGSFQVKGQITLVNPDKLTVGIDKLDFTNTNNGFITGFGFGVKSKDVVGNFTCIQDSRARIFTAGFGNETYYYTCTFPSGLSSGSQNLGAVVKGGKAAEADFTISGQNLQDLGLNTAGRKSIYVYPIMYYSGWQDGNPIVFNQGGKEIFVDVFDTQAQANAAPARPIDVVGYGATVTSAGGGQKDPGGFLLDLVNRFIGIVAGLINEAVYFLFYWIIAPALQAMLSIRTYTDTFAAVVYPGWEIVRNICNLFFIVALIAIALATLFRVESYHFRQLLVKLIIAALLVNFSLAIAQVVLGIADTIQNQFLPNNIEVIRSLARDLMVDKSRDVALNNIFVLRANQLGTFSDTIRLLLTVSMSLASFVILGAVAVFLAVRIVMLWILLMLSPIPYIAGILPSTDQFRGQWWSNFIKYAFFTPVMAFFLNVAALIANRQWYNGVFNSDLTAQIGDSNFATFVFSSLSNVLLLVFLIVAIKVADQFGIMGAHAFSEIAQKGLLAPFAAVGWGAKNRLEALNRWRQNTGAHALEHGDSFGNKLKFAALNPDALVKGWKARTHELDHMASSVAEARGREVTEQLRTGNRLNIPYAQFIERKEEDGFVKEYQNMSKEKMMAAAVQMDGWKGAEADMRKRALVKAAASQGYLDDLLSTDHFANKYADADGTYYSAEILNRFFRGYLGSSEQTMRMLDEDLEDLGKSTRHFEYLGHAQYNTKDKKFEWGMQSQGEVDNGRGGTVLKLKNTHQAAYASSEFAKLGGRARVEAAPHNFTVLRGSVVDGKFEESDGVVSTSFGRPEGEMDDFNRAMLSKMDASVLREVQHAQERMKGWLLGLKRDANSGELILENEQQFKHLKNLYDSNPEFIKGLYGRALGYDPSRDYVPGIKVVIMDTNGRHDPTTLYGPEAKLGDPETVRTPIVTTIADELKNFDPEGKYTVMVKLKEKPKSEAIKVAVSTVEDVYEGLKTDVQIETEIRAKIENGDELGKAGLSAAEKDTLAHELTTEIYSRVAEQYRSKYNPLPMVEDLAKKHNFSVETKIKLNRDLSEAAKQAFVNAKGKALDRGDLKVEIEKALTASSVKLTDEEVGCLISHMIPSKS